MKMTDVGITITAYFLTDTINWQVLWGKEKYIVCMKEWKQSVTINNVSSKDKQIY